MSLKILLVEDNDGDFVLVREYLNEIKEVGATAVPDHTLERAIKLEEAIEKVKQQEFSAILLDLSLPDAKNLEAFDKLKKEAVKTPIILLTGLNDFEIAKRAVFRGAQDFLIKDDVTGKLLWRAILYSLERGRANDEKERLVERINRGEKLESIGVLAGGLAHDLNNLLQGILNCSFLASRSDEKEHVSKQLEQIETLVSHAEDLINKLFTCSGKITFKYERINLCDFIEENKDSFKSCVPENHTINYELSTETKDIEIDPSQLRQVLINLISNGSEAIGSKPGLITIRTGSQNVDQSYLNETYLDDSLEPGPYSYFEVEDSGAGMDDSTVKRIFEPFFSTKKSGRGLGLASVHGIIKNSNATMRIDSKPGGGSCFKVLFPTI